MLKFFGKNEVILGIVSLTGIIGFVLTIFVSIRTSKISKILKHTETYKKVVEFSPDEYGEYITRLLNLVQSQFPSADAFIDDFLKVKE